MKISLDLDGTVWHHMGFFRAFMVAMQAQGNEVGILTGHHQDSEEFDRKLLASHGFPSPDFYFGRSGHYLGLNGSHMKADRIISEGINFHFDDMDYGLAESESIFIAKGVRERVMKIDHRGRFAADAGPLE